MKYVCILRIEKCGDAHSPHPAWVQIGQHINLNINSTEPFNINSTEPSTRASNKRTIMLYRSYRSEQENLLNLLCGAPLDGISHRMISCTKQFVTTTVVWLAAG